MIDDDEMKLTNLIQTLGGGDPGWHLTDFQLFSVAPIPP